MVGVTYQQIQKYEKGVNKVSAERLYKIAVAMKVSIDFFFEGGKGFVVAEGAEGGPYTIQEKKLLSPQEQELLDSFRSLIDEEVRSNFIGLLRSISRKINPF